MRKHRARNSERGQALILIMLSMVALLGFTALAVDGAMVYSDRRLVQNVADASSLAGGAAAAKYMEDSGLIYNSFFCGNEVYPAMQAAKVAAVNRAASNDFTMHLSGENRVETTCGVVNRGFWVDKYIDVHTYITHDSPTSLVHFVYNGPVRNSVEAITRIRPRMPLALGQAIVGLNNAACYGNQNGVQIGGSSQTLVHGGGIFSNGCMGGDGSGFSVTVDPGQVLYVGALEGTTTSISPPPARYQRPLPEASYQVEVPDCSSLPARNMSSQMVAPGIYSLAPGVYNRIIMQNTDQVHLDAGLYCITGSPAGVTATGGVFDGHDVTFYLTQGSFSISGGTQVNLSAPASVPDPSPALPGVLIYLAHGNSSVVSLEGNTTSYYLGSIYAPDGSISITGDSGTYPTFNTQLVGKNVFISGNATIEINFSDSQVYNVPAMLELSK